MLNYQNLFKNLSNDEISAIEALIRNEIFPADRIIFHEGDDSVQLYQIVKGSVRVSRRNDNGYSKYIGVLSDGDYFGELGIIDKSPRSATITTITESEIVSLKRDDFYDLSMKYPKILWSVAQVLSERLRSTTQRYLFLSTYGEPYRIIYTLVEQFDNRNINEENCLVSIEELCNFAGVSERESIRTLRQLEQEKIIQIDGEKISLINMKALKYTLDPSKGWI